MTWHKKLFWLLILLLPVQLGKHFWPEWSYVFGLRIDYLSPTIFLTDLLIFLILGLWVLEKPKIEPGRAFFPPLSIFIFLWVNSLLAQNSGAAVYKFLKILEFSFLGLYVAKNKIKLSFVVLPLSFSVVYSSLLAVAQFIRQSSLNGLFWFLGERTFNVGTPGIAKTIFAGRLLMRPYATFPHPNALAGYILVSLILTLPFIRYKLLAFGYWLLAVSALAITFSRSTWLVGLLILGLYLLKKKKIFPACRQAWLILYCLLLMVSFGFYFRFPADEAISQRWELAGTAIQMFRSHILSGVGLNNFIVNLPNYWQPKNQILWLQPVHNIYLLIAAEAGIISLLIFLWFLYLTFKKLNAKSYPLYIALLSILGLGLFDHYWLTLQQTQLLLTIILGFCWSEKMLK